MEVEVKKNKLERKYVFIGLILIVLIIIFGVTVSYFRSDFTSKNEIIGTGNSVIMSDTFVSPSNWMPGDELTTDFTISNPSNMSVSLRAKVEEKWNDSNLHNKLDNGEDVVLKTLGSNWVEYNGYYYYQNTLANHNSVSTTLFSKLTFNPKVEAGVQCTTVDDVRECSSNGTYTNSKYELKITYEFISSDASVDNWNYSTTINPYIKAVYTYNEETCQTGNESTCTYSTCLLDNSCVAGTIVDYQVDSDTTNNTNKNDVTSGIMRFHILTNSNNQVTMQSQRNVVKGIAWHANENDNSHGPNTIVPVLENATNGWSNVNTLNTTYLGATAKCDTSFICTNGYQDYVRNNNKARLISLEEIHTIDPSCTTSNGSCQVKWLSNYLSSNDVYNPTYYDDSRGNMGYWTSSSNGNISAWLIHFRSRIDAYGSIYSNLGARAVVEINTYRNGQQPNTNIVNAWTYDEDTCQANGEGESCNVSLCYLNKSVNSCQAGTIIDYQVKSGTTIRFNVLKDNGSILTLQETRTADENKGIKWYAEANDNSHGPITAIDRLETYTNSWNNVNDITYTAGITSLSNLGADNSCTPTSCSGNKYTWESRTAKARLITIQEANAARCTETQRSCAPYMVNYLNTGIENGNAKFNDNTNGNGGYWSMSAVDDASTSSRLIRYGSHVYSAQTNSNGIGVRAVIEINK